VYVDQNNGARDLHITKYTRVVANGFPVLDLEAAEALLDLVVDMVTCIKGQRFIGFDAPTYRVFFSPHDAYP